MKHVSEQYPLRAHAFRAVGSPSELITSPLDEHSVVYFFGHGRTDGEDFILSANGNNLSSSSLEDYLRDAFRARPGLPTTSHLVFLNACDTAEPEASDLARKMVAQLAATHPHRLHIVSTIAPVPCWAAVEFADTFLSLLLGSRRKIGMCLNEARRKLWDDPQPSPAGLLYAIDGSRNAAIHLPDPEGPA